MKLCISHIAWPAENEQEYLDLVAELGCTGLEIAPSRIWPEPVITSLKERYQYRSLVESAGLKIVSLHALLYTRPDLGLFKGNAINRKTIEYIKELCFIAGDLGAKKLVFGSPGNRVRGKISHSQAMNDAAEFFFQISEYARAAKVCLCIEPLGVVETDFITSALDGLELVQMVNSSGFGRHLASKAVSGEENDVEQVMIKTVPYSKHYHISEPGLAPISISGTVDHMTMGKILHKYNYKGYVSIEMRLQPDGLESIKSSLALAKKYYVEK